MEIEKIVEAIRTKSIRITDHADEETQADKLQYEEIYFSVAAYLRSLKDTMTGTA